MAMSFHLLVRSSLKSGTPEISRRADALNRLSTPAERMEVPADVDTVTYANADLTDTMNVLKQYGVRLLTPDEISKEMPDYPLEAFLSCVFATCYPLEWKQGLPMQE
jgi:hypothetical protein